jgi:2Fe-2S ferredoxin
MENATRNNVNGIVAECGGQCSCATCHVQVAEEWFDKVGPAEGDEEDMLEFAEERVPTSRLSCQIEVTEELDGLVVNVPESQG